MPTSEPTSATDAPLVPSSVQVTPHDGGPIPAVLARGLSKRFGDTLAVEAFDLTVQKGSLTALLGPSGCGKTTALRLIAGFETPDTGVLDLQGQRVADRETDVPPERRRIGMVFQDYALFPHLSVARNVAYGIQDLPRKQRRARVHEALELVELAGVDRRHPGDLSGGQQQRVALARALAPNPALILLDEPFSNLDASLRASVREDVARILRRAEATAVFVTHDQEEALSIADEVAVMRAGRVLQVATPPRLYSSPVDRFVATFVGDADLLPGRRASRYFVETALGRLPTSVAVEDQVVDVVIRPEALRLTASPDGNGGVASVAYFGHDQLVHVELADGTTLRARLGPYQRFERGDRVRVSVQGAVQAFGPDAQPDVPAGAS